MSSTALRSWTRQFLLTFLAGALPLVILALVTTAAIRRHSFNEQQTQLLRLARLAGNWLSTVEPARYQELVATQKENSPIRFTVIDSSGRVLADSRADPALMESHRLRPEVIQALREGSGWAVHRSRTLPDEMLYVAARTRTQDGSLLVVRTSISTNALRRLTIDITRRVLLAVLVLLVVAIALSLLTARGLARPVSALRQAAEQIAAGDFAVRVPRGGRDELGALTEAMNRMAERLQKLFTRGESERGLLEAVINAAQETIIVLDGERRIIRANQGLARDFGGSAVPGRFLWEAVRNAELQALVERVAANRASAAGEIWKGSQCFAATAIPLKGEEGATVVLLYDVTRFRELERAKSDLVANVSHELRTPLAAIKGYAELLEPDIQPETRRFLEIILRYTNRLTTLVNDLLTMSRLESPQPQLEKEQLDPAQVAADALKILESKIREKGLKTEVVVAPGTPTIHADRILLEQVFFNLLDNAVKYTEKGETTIRIGPDPENSRQVRIEVADTGIGIPAEHQQRVFERFYAVDRNRSRELGGTGLGLAIVKHAVLVHGGSITLSSTLGKGTTFTIILPV